MEGLFIITMLVDLSDLSITLDELVMGLRKIGEEINMETTPHLIVLARYMQILSTRVVDRYPFRIINIHPSLLPYHPGSNAYKQAWEEGVRVSGCTAHFVTEQLDAGPVILQDVFHIRVGEDALEDVKARGRALEAKVLSQAVQLYLNDQLVVKDKKVIFRPGRFPGLAAGRS